MAALAKVYRVQIILDYVFLAYLLLHLNSEILFLNLTFKRLQKSGLVKTNVENVVLDELLCEG